MDTQTVPLECRVCLEEIPASEKDSAEATDYVAHYCGLACYAQWREKPPAEPAEQGAPRQAA